MANDSHLYIHTNYHKNALETHLATLPYMEKRNHECYMYMPYNVRYAMLH